MVQSEDRLRIRRLERLCSKRRECELMVRFKSDANRHGRPSARHGPIAITARNGGYYETEHRCQLLCAALHVHCASERASGDRSFADPLQPASDAERQALISSWMSGYFSAIKNLSELDFRYVKRNATVVASYCKTHKSDTVMNAMQMNWR